jgi:HlyD family secretion protein
MRRWVIAILLIGAVLMAAIWAAYVNSGIPVQAFRVQRGEVREFVDERGKTRLPTVHRITAPQAGRIQAITLEEGEAVSQGQVVAQFIGADLDNEVAEAQAVVDRLDAAIRENDDVAVENSLALQAKQFVTSMSKTVGSAEAQMSASEKRAAYAETNLGRVRELERANARTEDELDQATLQYWEGQLGFRQDQLIVEAMKSIQAATALLPQMVSDYISRKNLSRAVLEKQKSEAEARLRQADLRRERGTMVSPIDGVVLKRLVQNEQHLAAGTELLWLGQLAQLEVEADILSQEVVRVTPGDEVEVYGPAVGAGLSQGVKGTVHKIFPAGFTKVSSLGVEQQRVRVIVQFEPDVIQQLLQRDIGVDYRVRVRIFTASADSTLLVPRSALFRGPDGGWQLFVIRGRKAVLQPVEVGLMNDAVAQVRDGVAEGDLVALAPETRLTHGARVKLITPD